MELFSSSSFFLLLIICHSLQLHKYAYADDDRYKICNNPFVCGSVSNLSYPFFDGETRPEFCGYPGYKLYCTSILPEMNVVSSERYYVLGVKPDQPIVTVARKDYWNGYFSENLHTSSINTTLFSYVNLDANNTLYYECANASTSVNTSFFCGNFNSKYPQRSPGYFVVKDSNDTYRDNIPLDTWKRSIDVPIANLESAATRITDSFSLLKAFRYGFELQWNAENSLCDECRDSGGKCGFNTTESRFTCYCPDQPYAFTCPGSYRKNRYMIAGAIISCSTIGIGMLYVFVYCLKRRSTMAWKNNQDFEALLRNHGCLALTRYTYRNLKNITNSFKHRLGEGGCGTVYRGKIQNDCLVAVKVLKKSRRNMEEFMNEVKSIGNTNHVNIVRLLGYCFEGQNRALVYEFMPNGSLEKFIYGRNNHQLLNLEKLFQIAVGIARGLEYLHRGCNTRILHFDIKPHNILLDEDFCPKISDFGLAKSYQQKESIISMSIARGTVGFIAPEVFLKSFGGVSHKSDVYSYGMLVLEMVGCRKNDNAEVEHSSEQYFPHWIYKKLDQTEEHDHDHEEVLDVEGKEKQRKMILVSLWCIQTSPASRPAMTKVVEMLEGPLESLQIPPMPSLASAPVSEHDSLTTNVISSVELQAISKSFNIPSGHNQEWQ